METAVTCQIPTRLIFVKNFSVNHYDNQNFSKLITSVPLDKIDEKLLSAQEICLSETSSLEIPTSFHVFELSYRQNTESIINFLKNHQLEAGNLHDLINLAKVYPGLFYEFNIVLGLAKRINLRANQIISQLPDIKLFPALVGDSISRNCRRLHLLSEPDVWPEKFFVLAKK